MRRSRLGAILAIVVLGAVGAVFASTAEGKSQADVRIGVFLASAANTYWTAELQGARDVAKKYGNVKLTVYDAQFNTQKQVNQLRDALISNKFDAWFIGPNDGGPLTPLIRRAIGKGVKVGCTLVPCGPDIRNAGTSVPGQTAFAGLGFFPERAAPRLGRARRAAGARTRARWRGYRACPSCRSRRQRTDGLYSIIKKNKAIKVVSVQAGGYLAAPALKATQNILQAHPGVDVIVPSGDQMIDGAYRAIRLAGIPDGRIKLYGNGCTYEAKRLIQQGKQAGCSVYLPRTQAKIVVDLLVRAVNGEQIRNRSIDPLTASPIGPFGNQGRA